MLKALDFRAFISHEELSEVLSLLSSFPASNEIAADHSTVHSERRSKKRGNEGEQPESEAALLPSKLQHDSKIDQVLVIAGERKSDKQPLSDKTAAMSVTLSCRHQDSSRSSLDEQSIKVQPAILVGGY